MNKKKSKKIEVNTIIDDGEVDEIKPFIEDKKTEPEIKKVNDEDDGRLKVSARQYCQARGIRLERAAGFLYFVDTQMPGHRATIPKWIKLHDEWLNKVV